MWSYLWEGRGPAAFLISCMNNSCASVTFFALPPPLADPWALSGVEGCSQVSGVLESGSLTSGPVSMAINYSEMPSFL